MNNNFLSLGLICAAAFTLTNCTKELVVSSKSDAPFEIIAETGTKTTTDGINTSWQSTDNLSVFYAAAGTTSYSSNLKFTNASGDSFKTSDAVDLSGAENFDWYAIYPYTSAIVSPNNDSKGYITVGGTSQTQEGNDSKLHLAGKACPLYGIVKNVASTGVPTFAMHHLTSIIEVVVNNNSGADLTVNDITFTASNESDIAGTYYVNFANPAIGIKYTGSGASYVSKSATLNVTGGTPIADGNPAKFYIAVKPFTADAGDELIISVNGYEKSVTVPTGGVDFKAGVINTITFNFNNAESTVSWTAASGALGSAISAQGGTASGTIKTGEFEWNYTRTLVSLTKDKKDYIAINNNYSDALQLGSSNALETIVLNTSNIPGIIKKVIVNSAGTNHKISITVNGIEYLSETTMAASLANYSGTGTESGEIIISIMNTGSTKKAFYLKSITVCYE